MNRQDRIESLLHRVSQMEQDYENAMHRVSQLEANLVMSEARVQTAWNAEKDALKRMEFISDYYHQANAQIKNLKARLDQVTPLLLEVANYGNGPGELKGDWNWDQLYGRVEHAMLHGPNAEPDPDKRLQEYMAAEENPDDMAIDRLAYSCKQKMAEKAEEGRGGWDDPQECSVESLADMLVDHVEKGDPVDIANFCAMLYSRSDYEPGFLEFAVAKDKARMLRTMANLADWDKRCEPGSATLSTRDMRALADKMIDDADPNPCTKTIER